jgi:Pyruvate/2-oxoacid:ferredoxin oxidoreductase delta subunit
MVDGKADIDHGYCKGCGICVEECPVKAIDFVQETI